MSNKSDILLIFDLDETLVHATKNRLEIEEQFQFDQYYIYRRPNLEQFLIDISKHFKIGIWSSAGDEYVSSIVNLIKPVSVEFEIVWGRSKCSIKRDLIFDQYCYEKRLDKLKRKGYKLEQILIVDDSPEKSRSNYGNAIQIKEYSGDLNDSELSQLYNYLISLKNVENVRQMEKRNWRTLKSGA